MPTAVIEREAPQPVLGLLALLVLAEQLGVVPEREVDVLQPVLDLAGHRAQVARAVRVGEDVDAPEQVLVADGVRRRLDLHRGDVRQPHLFARGRVDA